MAGAAAARRCTEHALSARLRAALPALVVVVAALSAHGGDVRNGFVWDDEPIVVESPVTKDVSRLGEVLLSPDEVKPYYRPLNRASYLLDYRVAGLDPRWFHLVNVLVHAASALALYALGRRLFARRGPALVAALLLAVHPIHVEAVAFVSARNNLFALLFGLVTLLLFVDATRRRSAPLAIASGVAFLAALASKEPGLMVLPVLAAWLYWPGLPGREAGPRRWALLVPHAAALVAYLALRSVALGGPVASAPILPGLASRLAQNYYVLPRYLVLSLFPRDLAVFHDVPDAFWSTWWLPFAWLVIAAVLAYLVRRPSVASTVGLLWLGFHLLPIVNIVPIPSTVIAERFFHASAAGLWLVVADLAARVAAHVPRPVAVTAATVVIAALGVRTIVRGADWRDDPTLFRSAVRVAPRSALAHFNLGVALKDAGDLEGARREWLTVLEIKPGDPGAHAQLGTLAAVHGRLADAEAHYRAALAGDPGLAEANLNLGRICERTGRADQARRHYRAVLDASPAADPAIAAQAAEALRRLGASGR